MDMGALSTPSDDDETRPQALIRPHLPQEPADAAALDCDPNHGSGVGCTRCVEDPCAPDERVAASGQVDADLVTG